MPRRWGNSPLETIADNITGKKRSYSDSKSTDMPIAFKKSRRIKRKTFRRKRFVRKGRPAGLGRKVAKLWQDAEVARPPKHILFSDSGISGGNVSGFASNILAATTPRIVFLTPCSRSTTVQGRLADYIYVSKIHFSVQTQYGTNVTGDQYTKWMIFVHKQPGGAALSAATFLSDYYGTSTPNTFNIPNRNNKSTDKYRILKKGSIQMKETVAGVVEKHNYHIKCMFKHPIKVSLVLGNAGTIADCDGNAIYLIMWTDSTATVSGVQSYFEGNVYYRDQV
nr:MAG: capsid protein [Cressdnaviricota sp.]